MLARLIKSLIFDVIFILILAKRLKSCLQKAYAVKENSRAELDGILRKLEGRIT